MNIGFAKIIIELISILLASITVMLIHEIPKTMVYMHLNPLQRSLRKSSIFNIRQYIDPIGLILMITTKVGFSKPYNYRIKDKKTNLVIGVVGISSLIIFILFVISFFIGLKNIQIKNSYIILFIEIFFENCLYLSIAMLIINILPITPLDMSHIIANKSPSMYFKIYQNEKLYQLLLMILIIFGVINSITGMIVYLFKFLFLRF